MPPNHDAAEATTGAAMPAEPEVLVRREGGLGRITLNRPRAINALNLTMVTAIDAALRGWATDPAVGAVLVDGAGERGLCAGGDIRFFYECARRGDPAPREFWAAEYRLNARISHYPKPYIALMDGLVMGGGIGVSAHGGTRVVTDRSVLSMPEVGIGFIPDVGGTYLLSRMPGELGTHLALTAARLGAADAIAWGLADHYLPHTALPRFVDLLRAAATSGGTEGAAKLLADLDWRSLAADPGHGDPAARRTPGEPELAAQRAWIDDCYRHDSPAAILAALRSSPVPAARAAAEELAAKSPTSVTVTLRALRSARRLADLNACLDQEYRLASAALTTHDLVEGIRAAVVDKDRDPRWSPARLEDVDPAEVDRFFRHLGAEELGLAGQPADRTAAGPAAGPGPSPSPHVRGHRRDEAGVDGSTGTGERK